MKNDEKNLCSKRRLFVLFIGLSGLLGVIFNIIIGVGWCLQRRSRYETDMY